ncbi:hypothetical protein BH23CHL4_BH23CHL4_27130 [soil metagenome]
MTHDNGARLSPQELEIYLQLGLTARLACLDGRGWPYIVPIWHHWDGERFWIIASKGARWAQYLLESPRVALSIDEPETVTRVLCKGLARHIEGPVLEGRWVSIALQMAERYMGADMVATYQINTAGMERWLFAVEVETLISWRGPGNTN